ncbi:AIR synthase-related protein [Variovorax boronicumulans]|uniref:sll0787 family AIR synthase-like protein n=1 Tax=Variovorax TaxID=34072 RepID=UPI00277D5C00|nr:MULTISPECIES: sll0787 family AIR synthase-like protein [Variovorax]MDQ0034168.1 AIR synthase-related protein [Variovorax boronicumulans]MDQ0043923.1 AIR synthase-related protein [Variovorax boronicumulans]MDQ0612171.1 AIR synthase-related protein [Variovorax sp. W1I1]
MTTSVHDIAEALRATRGFAHKRDISDVVSALGRSLPGGHAALAQAVPIGDDCAAIPDGHGGYLLFAIEGLVEDFIVRMPWFAGYCGVMVNVSDIYAMGGRPTAVVDALWSTGMNPADDVLRGLAEAAVRYGVPIVGGHSNNRSERPQLAVAILGHARKLLTSFDAKPGELLVMAADLRGAYEEPFPYWNASTTAPAARLRADLELLPALAEDGLCCAGKDISMAGAVGTAMMLLECSGVGARIDIDALPRPDGAPLMRWLSAFPSYGFMLSVKPAQVAEVLSRFAARDIACAVVGEVDATRQVRLRANGEEALLWDFGGDAFIQPPQRQQQEALACP